MSKISYVVEFSITAGTVDQFKTQAEGFIATVREHEPDTLGYQG